MNKLQDKVVWITGASSGIGEALAYAFSKEGRSWYCLQDVKRNCLRVKAKCANSTAVEIVVLDMVKTDEILETVKLVVEKMKTIDILVNCAGVSQRSLAADTSMEVYRKIMEVNYFGTIQLSLAVLQHYISKNEGQFVAISSVAGKVGLPLRTAYCAAKYALEGFFSSLKTETWKTNIKILIVRPGAVKTNIADNALTADGSSFSKKDKLIEGGISAEACAEAIVEAIVQNRKELVVGSAKEKLLFVLNRFLPGLTFNIVKKL